MFEHSGDIGPFLGYLLLYTMNFTVIIQILVLLTKK